MKSRLKIDGMTCASCVSKVEQALTGVLGVKEARVNLALNLATIEFDEPGPSLKLLIDAVKKSGYSAHSISKTIKDLRNKDSSAAQSRYQIFKIGTSFSIAMILMFFGMKGKLSLETQFFLCLPIQFYIGFPFLAGLYNGLRHRRATMDTLVGMGTLSAFLYSTYNTFSPNALHVHGYYEISASLIAFVLLGKQLEERAKKRTSSALEKLIRLTPDKVFIVKDGKEFEIEIEELNSGDRVRVRPGEHLPADGQVVFGQSAIDESMLTGESLPITKGIGANVFAGTLNQTGSFEFEIKNLGESTVLSKIVQLVVDAQSSKTQIERTADQVSAVFVPAVIGVSFLAFAIWFYFTHSFSDGLLSAISVLVMACPCALGLAVPTAIIVATGRAAQNGILFKDAQAIEKLAEIQTLVFDKTGTLTQGHPALVETRCFNSFSKEEVLRIAASVENASGHPIGRAIVNAAKEKQLQITQPDFFDAVPGQGIRALFEKHKTYIGTEAFLKSWDITIPELADKDSTQVLLAIDGKFAAQMLIEDTLRPESIDVIRQLKNEGFKIILLSGDRAGIVNKTAQALQIDLDSVYSEASPEKKLQVVGALKNVAMIGDGINDTPALSKADVGVTLAAGSDIAVQSADLLLMKNDLRSLIRAIQISRHTRKTIRQNLAASLIYNIIGVPIAAGILYPWFHIRLHPVLAGAAMTLSSVSVVLNSLRNPGPTSETDSH